MPQNRRATSPPVNVTPNMVDRIFMLLDGLQASANLFLFVRLDGDLEPNVLTTALRQTLEELPLLRTLITRGKLAYTRRVVPLEAVDLADVLRFSDDVHAEAALLQEPLDLEQQLPVRVLVTHGAPTRLTVALNHCTGDASGGFFFIDRLAQRYTALIKGEPCPALVQEPVPRSYFHYVWRLPKPVFLNACLRVARTFVEVGMPWSKAARELECAAFTDQALPTRGALRCRLATLEAEQLDRLKAWARQRGGTLSDLLLSVAAVVGRRLWAPSEQRAIIAMLPVSLRTEAPRDVTNRVSELSIRVPSEAADDLSSAFEAVRMATPAARDGVSAAAKIFERALMSRLPPGLFRPLAAKHFDQPVNRSLTFVFSNLGVIDPMPGDFGDRRTIAATFIPPLSTPPGFGLGVTTLDGRLTYCVGYNHPAISEESAQRFVTEFAGTLERLAQEPVETK